MKYYKLVKKYPSLPKNWEDGMLVGQGDRGCNAKFSPCSGKYTDFYIRPEEVINNPEFWKEVREDDFIILKFKNTYGYFYKLNYDGHYVFEENNKSLSVRYDGGMPMWFKSYHRNLNYMLETATKCSIYQVIRKSDGISFSLGDFVKDEISNSVFKIEHIFLEKESNTIIFNHEKEHLKIKNAKKINQVFLTEDDFFVEENEKVYPICITNGRGFVPYEIINHKWNLNEFSDIGFRYFLKKENSEEFIIENKPCLSYKDVEKILSKYIPNENYCLKEIKKLAKNKIENYGIK
jgi:hypothetical protein